MQLLDTPAAKVGVLEDLVSHGYITDVKNSRPRAFVSGKSFEGYDSVYMLQYEPESQFELSLQSVKHTRIVNRTVTKVGRLLASANFTAWKQVFASLADRQCVRIFKVLGDLKA